MTYNSAATIATNPILTFTDNITGLPLAGGKLYTYASGTTTLQVTYTDNTLTTQNPNPITLNNYGQATVWLGPLNYRFNLLNAAGVTQAGYPMDNIQPASSTSIFSTLSNNTQASSGAGLIGFNPSLTYPLGTVGYNLSSLGSFPSNLALNTLPINGSGLVGYASSNAYAYGTVGGALNASAANYSNLALNSSASNGAGLVGFSALNTYSAGTVGYALNNVPAFVGQSKFNFTPSTNAAPNVGDVWFDSAQHSLTSADGAAGNPLKVVNGGVIAVQTIYPAGNVSASVTPAATGTQYPLYTSSDYSGTFTLPANFFVPGKTIDIDFIIQAYSTSVSNTISIWLDGIGAWGAVGVTIPLNCTTFLQYHATLTCSSAGGAGVASIFGMHSLVNLGESNTGYVQPNTQNLNNNTSFSTLVSHTITLFYTETQLFQVYKQCMKITSNY